MLKILNWMNVQLILTKMIQIKHKKQNKKGKKNFNLEKEREMALHLKT